ncbi:MAG: glycoside hydrolase family 28 protein [Draconibacterium sp.]|nr:glycoside hydrolase family 28 protein [Draconibacterium sp.]
MNRSFDTILIFLLVLFISYSCTQIAPKTIDYNTAWSRVDTILSRIYEPEIKDIIYNINDFGAIGNGEFDNKEAFDSAIKICSENGGGKIVVSAGVYKVNGPIHLKSNINLHLSKGAKITFGSNPEFYLPVVKTSWEGTRLYNYSPFIYAFKQKNIAITGSGEIDGEASQTWNNWKKNQKKDKLLCRKMNNENVPVNERIFGAGHLLRPQLIQFYGCENILVDSIKISDSPFWCLHLLYSKNIIIRNVRYDAQNFNNDGIDPESSEDILIENIKFSNKDDNIAIKSGRDLEARTLNRSSQNIIIRNCSFGGYNALAIGSEMSGGVNNIFVEDCTFSDVVINGVYLKGNKDRGGVVSDIHIRNIEFGKTESTIIIDSDYKNEGSCCPPLFKNIFIENVTSTAASKKGIFLKGSAEVHLNNINIKNVEIENANEPISFSAAENINLEQVTINGKDLSGFYK